jgi:hypothetical protein
MQRPLLLIYKLNIHMHMKVSIPGLCFFLMSVQSSYAQQPPTESIKTATNNTPEQQKIINLSKQKWDWMSEKNVDSLNVLFDDKAMFIHMEEPWGKPRNLLPLKAAASGIRKRKCTLL